MNQGTEQTQERALGFEWDRGSVAVQKTNNGPDDMAPKERAPQAKPKLSQRADRGPAQHYR